MVYPGGKASAGGGVVGVSLGGRRPGNGVTGVGGLAALRVLASVPPLLGGGGLPAGQGRRKERRARLGW